MTFLKTSETQLKGLIKPSKPYVAILVDEMMRNESTMTELHCLHYDVEKNDVAAFAASLEQNTTLKILRLGYMSGELVLFYFCLGGVCVTLVRLRCSCLSGIDFFCINLQITLSIRLQN
jgi:hypothetical protein